MASSREWRAFAPRATAATGPGAVTAPRLLLGGILLLAGILRFPGLAAGLAHPINDDEYIFVESAASMLQAGDLDHRFYEYGGLFVYLIAPVVGLFGPASPGPPTLLAVRVLVALSSVVSVALVYVLGRRLAGPAAGLMAALLLAVSPLEVETAHGIRPDVVLETLVLLAMLAFARVGTSVRADVVSGAALGAATALKFSGALLAPSYLAYRLLAPGPRVTRVLLAAAVSVLTFAVLSPYCFIHFDQFLPALRHQAAYHYIEEPYGARSWGEVFGTYLRILVRGLGWPAAALAGVGLQAVRAEWRRFLPLLLFPLALLAVLSTAERHRDRLVVPALCILAVFAACGWQALGRRSRWAGVAAGVLAVAVPLADSARYVRDVRVPQTRDQTVDWIEKNVPPGSRILITSLLRFGIDPRRYEVMRERRLDARTRYLARHMDLLITGIADDRRVVKDLRSLARISPTTPQSGPPVWLGVFPVELRPRYDALSLKEARLSASQASDRLVALTDDDPATVWSAGGGPSGEPWLEVVLPGPATVGRVELLLAPPVLPRRLPVALLARAGDGWTCCPPSRDAPLRPSRTRAGGR